MEADEEYDNDSACGDSVTSSTTSLRSAVTEYQFEHGRRYHAYKSGHYAFPNDDDELDRMDLEHHIFGLIVGQLHLAPLNSPQKILDLGTGTGLWAIDAADKYPSAEVIGTDLSPIQPKWVPPNVQFQVDDFEADWTFGHNTFDFVFARLLIGSITDYPHFYKQAFDALKPGGYIEIQDIDPETYCDDGSLKEDHAVMKWGKLFKEAMLKMGRRIPEVTEYRKWVQDAGFVDIEEIFSRRPSNDWPKDKRMKEIGKWECLMHMEGIEAFTVGPFTRCLDWSIEEAQVMIAQVRSEWPKRSLHGYQKVILLHARKPS